MPLVTTLRSESTDTLDTAVIDLPPTLALEREDGRVTRLAPRGDLEIGSDRQCSLVLEDRYASRRHARIVGRARGHMLEDLGSKNGTRVDGVRVERGYLQVGMCVRIGRSRLLVVHPSRPTATTARDGSDGPAPRDMGIVGESPALYRALRSIPRVAPLEQPVLVRGETGTGKELVARALHRLGQRKPDAPFVAINCGAVADQIAHSELFGHARGAFTGATRAREGAFVRAAGGTLFLDEVGELSPSLQAALLRVIETRRCLPVGGEREQVVDARIVAATHRDLEAMVTAGTFREDLYHRLAVFSAELPPLRERAEDIPLLVEHFSRSASAQLGRQVTIHPAALDAARAHPWPGNVRQLKNAVARAIALCDGSVGPTDLVPRVERVRHTPSIEVPRGDYHSMNRALLEHVLVEAGSVRKAAALLDVPRSTLAGWLKR